MNIFLFENYRNLLKKTITSLPKEGHGQAKKLAQYLGVSTTLISQILAEQKHMTLDQAFLSTEFFTFNELESRYFIALVQYEKAGSKSFKMSLQKDLNKYREQSQKLEKRLTHQQILTEEQKAYFYSDWTYSAIRMLSSIKDFDSPDAIAEYFKLSKKTVADRLHFLENAQLVKSENGKLSIGTLSTHINAESPWVRLHHTNWRQKALGSMNDTDPQKLHYTSPMTLSQKDVEKIRSQLVAMIGEIGKTVDDSPSQQLMCLNIDWFRVR